jgi:hypothetical protein
MKKNILIAILCVTILLLVPFTSISGASVSGLNTKVEIVEEVNPVIPYNLFEELVESINQLLIDYGDIPEVVDTCNEALEVIDSIIKMDIIEEICLALYVLYNLFLLAMWGCLFFFLSFLLEGNLIEALKSGALCIAWLTIATTRYCIAIVLNCEWPGELNQEINILLNKISLNPQINPESISEYDITTIQGGFDTKPDDFTLEDLRDFVIKIDLLFGQYPKVAESCENIIEILDTPYPKLCQLYVFLWLSWGVFGGEVINVLKVLGIYDTPFGQIIWLSMVTRFLWLSFCMLYFCWDEEESVNYFGLNELINIEKSNQCPCLQV